MRSETGLSSDSKNTSKVAISTLSVLPQLEAKEYARSSAAPGRTRAQQRKGSEDPSRSGGPSSKVVIPQKRARPCIRREKGH